MPPLDPVLPYSDLEDISGAFELEITARFDALSSGYWQRMFDIGDGPNSNNILLTQYENTNDVMFALYQGGTAYRVVAPDAIIEGETATWTVGIDPDGQMWIDKDGARLATAQGVVPEDVPRLNELIAQSNWSEDTPLDGAVLGFDITNAGEAADGGRLNDPAPIDGAFQVDAIVRFDDLLGGGAQTVFSYDGGPGENGSSLFQVANSNDIRFELTEGGTTYSVTAEDAVTEGEWAMWSAGAQADGTIWIARDGVRLAEAQGAAPTGFPGATATVGAANAAGDEGLDGVVLDLTVSSATEGSTPTDPVDPTPPADPVAPTDPVDPLPPTDPAPGPADPAPGDIQIDGAFQIDISARFDSIQGGYWQRLFDIGSGPATNNILLTQYENTSDMMLQIWQDGSSYSITAENAIEEGVSADWSAGIDADGRMWIARDGTLLAEGQGVVPADVDRSNVLVGQSNWAEDTPLIGQVGALSLTQDGVVSDPVPPTDPVAPTDPMDPADPLPLDPPADPVDPATGAGDMVFVAHQDDDLLFMNPTIAHLIAADAPVSVVYLTAGNAGQGEEYWSAREAGELAAYGNMAGADDWMTETVSVTSGEKTFDVTSQYLESQPDIRLYFLRLPDGFADGNGADTDNFESLQRLWNGDIATITAVDDSATYTRDDLTNVLSSLIERHDPDSIHLQDHTSDLAGIEHSDHLFGAEFATAAIDAYTGGLSVTSYVGYASWGLNENLTAEEEAQVRDVFDSYAAFDGGVRAADGSLLEAYEQWVQREYVAESYTHPGDAAMQALMIDGPTAYDTAPADPTAAEEDPAFALI